MSFEYLVMTKEELVELFGEPIDDTPVDPKQLLLEGWYNIYDENGKDTTNVNYGRDMSDEKNPNYGNRGHCVHTEEWCKTHSEFMTGETNPNWKGGLTKDPDYKARIMREYRARKKARLAQIAA